MSSFDSSHFSQVKGAATGTRRVPGYTYLFVGCVLCSKYTLTPLHNSFYATLMTALVLPHDLIKGPDPKHPLSSPSTDAA